VPHQLLLAKELDNNLARLDDVDMGWPSDTTASCVSTTSTLKSDIIEAWKRRKKK
jgi:hypothetical protein